MGHDDRSTNWRLWLAATLGLLLFVVALQNSQEVDVDILMVNVTAPLIVIILGAAAIGGVIGYVAPLIRRHRRGERQGS